VIAFIFDLFWVFLMYGTWYSNSDKSPEGDVEAGTKSVEVVLTILSLIF